MPLSEPCVEWEGSVNQDGYGVVPIVRDGRNTTTTAHRELFRRAKGLDYADIHGLDVDHLCRNRTCVNPAHMELVTHAENVRRRDPVRFSLSNRGENNGRAKVTERTVWAMRLAAQFRPSLQEMTDAFPLSATGVRKVWTCDNWGRP